MVTEPTAICENGNSQDIKENNNSFLDNVKVLEYVQLLEYGENYTFR